MAEHEKDAPDLMFESGGKTFLIPVDEVEQVVAGNAFTIFPLPLPNDYVEGVANLDGRVVAVLCFPSIAHVETNDEDGVLIVARSQDDRFAFLADSIIHINDDNTKYTQDIPTRLSADEMLRSIG